MLDKIEFLLAWYLRSPEERLVILRALRREVELTRPTWPDKRRWEFVTARALVLGDRRAVGGAAGTGGALLWTIIALPALIIVATELAGVASGGTAAVSLVLALANAGLMVWMRKRRLAAERTGPHAY